MYSIAIRRRESPSDFFWNHENFKFEELNIDCQNRYWLADPFLFEKGGKVYTTPVEGIQTEVQWIDGTNVENQSVRIPTYGGMPYTATTHMVSEEKLAEIKAKIEEAKRKEEETLTIDVNDRKKEFFDDVTNSLEGIALRGHIMILWGEKYQVI